MTVKLRDSHEEAMPDDTPIEMTTGWIEESYRLMAPKKLVSLLVPDAS